MNENEVLKVLRSNNVRRGDGWHANGNVDTAILESLIKAGKADVYKLRGVEWVAYVPAESEKVYAF